MRKILLFFVILLVAIFILPVIITSAGKIILDKSNNIDGDAIVTGSFDDDFKFLFI